MTSKPPCEVTNEGVVDTQTVSETSTSGLTVSFQEVGHGDGGGSMVGLQRGFFEFGSPGHAGNPALCTEQLERLHGV